MSMASQGDRVMLGEARVRGRAPHAGASAGVLVPSGSPFAASSVRWCVADDRWAATLVVKATLHLEPVEARLSKSPEPIATADRFASDGPFAALRVPSDLAPLKRHPEVMLVGRAFAAPGGRARSLLARLAVGSVDKTIEIRPPRLIAADGRVTEESPWEAAPVGYELAAGGTGTWNPIGIAPSELARRGLPRLAHPGASWHPDAPLEPVSFGPISPAWPVRAERLAGHHDWVQGGMRRAPFPATLDPLFFQSAPVDQLLEALGPNERIVLEHLSPDRASLETRLPGIAPRASVERPGRGAEPIELVADTLWVDTERRICTLTWRGLVTLSELDEPIVMRVAETPAWISETPSTGRPPPVDAGREERADTLTGTMSLPAFDPVTALPFRPSPSAYPAEPTQTRRSTLVQPASEPPPASPPLPSIPAAPLMPSGLRPAAPPRPSPPPPSPVPPGPPGPDALLEISNAAAGANERPRARTPNAPAKVPQSPEGRVADVIDLVWFDPKSLPRIRKPPAWRAIVEALEERPPDPELDDAALAESTARAEDRRDVFEIVVRGEASDGAGVEAGLGQAIREDGKVVPPLMLVAGSLSLPFDEVEVLRAHVNVVAPFAPGDEKLSSEVDLVRGFLSAAELGCSSSMQEALTVRLWTAFARAKRAVAAETLQSHADAVLLQRRRFQHREVFGGDHVRAVLDAGGAHGPLPTYLPASVASSLPLYQQIRARLIAEVHPSVDQHESCPIALRVVAFARNVPRISSCAPAALGAESTMRGRR